MVKLTCKFPAIQNVSLIARKHYLLEFNWYRAITQCTHPVNVLTTKLGIKIVHKRIPTRRNIAILQLWLDGSKCHLVKKRQASAQATLCQMGTQPPQHPHLIFGTCLLWPNGRPSQQLNQSVSQFFIISSCCKTVHPMLSDPCLSVCLCLSVCSVLFLSLPRSERWPHHGRTFSIYLYPLSF